MPQWCTSSLAEGKQIIRWDEHMEELRSKLDKLIIRNNFNLTAPEVVRLSQELDIEVVKEQKRLLCRAA